MGWRAIKTVWIKELVDTVRDKRTMYMMVLLPLVLMPVIFLAGPLLMQQQEDAVNQSLPSVVFVGDHAAAELADTLTQSGTLNASHVAAFDRLQAQEAVRNEEFDLVVFVAPRTAPEAPVELDVVVESARGSSNNAFTRLNTQLEAYAAGIVSDRLTEHGLSTELLEPFRIAQVNNVTTESEIGARLLGMFLPFLISMWAVMGGMYTAIDVAAGEKERGTLESLLMAPVSRSALIVGKLLAISTVSLIANLLLIASMVASIFVLMPMLLGGDAFALSFQIAPLPLLLIVVLMVLFIVMTSALLFALSAFGKSFREGQSYTTALTFAVMLPGMYFAFVEEIAVANWVYAVPVFNVLLMLKNLLEGAINWSHLGITFVSLTVCAGISVLAAFRIFLSERVLFRS